MLKERATLWDPRQTYNSDQV